MVSRTARSFVQEIKAMEDILSNAGNIMAASVVVLLGVAVFKLWQQSREGGDKGASGR